MDGSLVQNTMDTFSEARYYLNVNIMVIFDQYTCSNIIAAALGLELGLRVTKAVHTAQTQYTGTMQT